MKTFQSLLLYAAIFAVMLMACSGNGSKSTFSADNPNFAYIGRFDNADKAKPVFMYSGCAIRTIFEGSSAELIMKDDSLRNLFTVIIDDSLFVITTNRTDSVYTLAEGLDSKMHTLEIIRRTEWHGGNTTFLGLRIDKGKKLLQPEIKDRRVEFIGDSYTCGYGNEGLSREENFRYDTENNYLTYGAITARALNAEYLTVCRSGIGIVQGYGGGRDFTMPALYDEVTLNNPSPWDYSQYQPQLVVIDLGANDLSAPLDSAEFVMAYVDFLKRIRLNYPSAKIVCCAGPSTPGKEWLTWKNYIHAVADLSGNTGTAVHYFEFSTFEPNGSDWHPNVTEHRNMADELIPFLQNLMNW